MEFVLFSLLVLAGIIALNWFIANEFYAIAKMKGHPQKKYFWWAFWLGIVGWAMVIALPNRAGISSNAITDIDELPEL